MIGRLGMPAALVVFAVPAAGQLIEASRRESVASFRQSILVSYHRLRQLRLLRIARVTPFTIGVGQRPNLDRSTIQGRLH